MTDTSDAPHRVAEVDPEDEREKRNDHHPAAESR
jgi:hypothetical protein